MATERAKRPEDFARSRPNVSDVPTVDAHCPFCPGHEEMTPDAILSIPHGHGKGGWDVRVVPNKFPALVPNVDAQCIACSTRVGPYLRRDGVGEHEVVIETQAHNLDLPLLPTEHMVHVMEAYRMRYLALQQLPSTELVVIFRNHGVKAGTSLLHPHSQIVASSVVPFPVRNKLYEGQRYFDMYGRCVYCDIIAYEQKERTRVIMENEHFLAITPYASSAPYEITLLPKHHRASFGRIAQDELHDLAYELQNLLARLWRLLDDPDYNYVIDTAPEHMAHVPFYHWHLGIYPRLTTPAGFEIGSGIPINIALPEQAAAELRDTSGARLTMTEAIGKGG